MTGIVFHPREPGLVYLRTDVGGAYRRDSRGGSWIPLLDGFGAQDWNLQGVESLAVDPTDPDKVYVAAGTYAADWAPNGAILRSRDRGRTWLRTDLPFRLGANEAGRGAGERLAVDPGDPRILFMGTRSDGLWRSADSGGHWSRVGGFPKLPEGETSVRTWGDRAVGLGVACVRFDPGSVRAGRPAPLLYAAVSTPALSLWRSVDAGANWKPVIGQPTGMRPNHLAMAKDGLLYVSYGREPGPDSMTDGSLWRLDPRSGTWTDITPIKPSGEEKPFGYGAVAADPSHPETILAATFCRWARHDELFRSTDRGAHWKPLIADAQWDRDGCDWTASLRPHWLGCAEVDPFDPDHSLFTTGYGIWEGSNLTQTDSGTPARWVFADNGLEETVPEGLASPPEGAHLLSAIADLDGFRHADLDRAAPQFQAQPRFSSSEAIDFAEARPGLVARIGIVRTNPGQAVSGAVSLDGGLSWKAFVSAPPVRGEHPTLAVSADGGVILWASSGSGPFRTDDRGGSWKASAGAPQGLRVAADRADPRRFYGYDPESGAVYVSDDAGTRFTRSPARMRPDSGRPSPWPEVRAVPGCAGELWLAAGFGLFHSTDAGRSFTRTPLDSAYAVGLGKAAPGSSRPAVFAAGTLAGREGVLRSDDEGRTWVFITDAAHQFGQLRAIAGDSRIYGRVYLATGGRGIVWGERKADPGR